MILLLIGTFSPLISYLYDGVVWECNSRYSFPTTCCEHFADNIATVDSWMEADDKNTITSFRQYLHLIPRCYEADCCHCFDCNGVSFNLYRGYDDPTNIDGREPLCKLHTMAGRGLSQDCENDSGHCEDLCWNGAYFRLWNHKYIHFFKHFLEYSSENIDCDCYWPEIDENAACINNDVYNLLKDLSNNNLLLPDFSPFWKAISYFYNYGKKIHLLEYFLNSHGMASSLVTYTFFYSQYHQMLLSIIGFMDSHDIVGNSKVIEKIYEQLDIIRQYFSYKYNLCLKKHSHPKIYYERGMLKMHSGDFEGAFTDVSRFMQLAKQSKDLSLTSDMYQQEGQLYNELGMYDQAIQALTEAIKLDPNNRGAYFNRSQAYFETGRFDLSIQDYMSSHIHESYYSTKLKPSLEVKEAILKGLLDGGKEAIVDFFPSLCASACGLGTCLWTFIEHPIGSTENIMNACYDVSQNISDFFKNVDLTNTEIYVDEFLRFQGNFDRLSESEKAHLTGYLIGKYGVDIFAGGVVLKSVALCKKLKDANQIANLEALVASKKSKKAIKAVALNHTARREAFFKNVKIHWSRQNKHIPGKHNYDPCRGVITLQENKLEELIKKNAGKGQKVNKNLPMTPGYKERIDFGEIIGDFALKEEGKEVVFLPTTRGILHYSKDGAHLIPSAPEGFVK